MTMLKKIATMLVGLTAALLLTLGLAGSASAETTAVDPTAAQVTGTLADDTGAVTGTFDVQNFVTQNGSLQAVGTFTGTVTNGAGNTTQGTQQLAIPVDLAQSAGSCQILDLVLEPLDLDLLGLQVHLDTLHLNITAQSGPGELVGNLLCAVAGLLDGGLPLNTISRASRVFFDFSQAGSSMPGLVRAVGDVRPHYLFRGGNECLQGTSSVKP